MYKFRSMYKNAEERKKQLAQETGQEDQLMFKMEHDPRIIGQKQRPDGTWKKGIGGWIRDLSIDEFPQFFNVLKGDMAFIGPRPLLVQYLPLYSKEQMRRHDVRPGITGWAQCHGRNALSWAEKFKLDVWYVDHLSLATDLKVIALTIRTVLTHEGINNENAAAGTMDPFNGHN
jgi:lipopolysaccharide/colanic/teichoic acid biosynthesis glycosyltransferase